MENSITDRAYHEEESQRLPQPALNTQGQRKESGGKVKVQVPIQSGL